MAAKQKNVVLSEKLANHIKKVLQKQATESFSILEDTQELIETSFSQTMTPI